MKVLLVDDSQAMRVLVRRALLETGVTDLQLSEARNGSDGLIVAAKTQPELILSEWMMPEMSGVQLLRELRARKSPVRFGFVVAEGPSPHMCEMAYDAGAQFVLGRPLSSERLLEVLEEHVLGSAPP